MRIDFSLKILKYRNPDKSARTKYSMETMRPKTAGRGVPALNIADTLIKPLKPRKSTIEITIITMTMSGHKYMKSPSLAFYLQSPMYAK